MAWDDVKEHININGYSDAQAQALWEQLEDAYTRSETFRGVLDKLSDSNELDVNYEANSAYAAPRDGNYAGAGFLTKGVYFDPTYGDNLSIVDDNGEVGAFTSQYILIHEAIHVIEQVGDLGPDPSQGLAGSDPRVGRHHRGDGDYVGDTERLTKEVLDDLGVDMQRVSYPAAARLSDLPIGTQLTNGEAIDNAVVSGAPRIYMDDLDSEDRDLAVGIGPGAHDIRTGKGGDFVRSGDGADTVDLGEGDDRGWLGDGNDLLIEGRTSGSDIVDGGAGFDAAVYSQTFAVGDSADATGLDIRITDASITVVNGTEADVLSGFEALVGSGRNDVFTAESVSGNMYINGFGGDDELVVSGEIADGTYVLDPSNGVIPAGEPGAGLPYEGRITNGTETVYYQGIGDDDVSGFIGVQPTQEIERGLEPQPDPEQAVESRAQLAPGLSLDASWHQLETDQPALQQIYGRALEGASSAVQAVGEEHTLELFHRLHVDGVAELPIRIEAGMSPEDRTETIMKAAVTVAQDRGIELPSGERPRDQEVVADIEAEYDYAVG